MKSPASLPLSTPLALPNGAIIPNRVAKAAMEENMANAGQLPGAALRALYGAWARGGAGLLVTGNVMIDGRANEAPAMQGRSADGRTLAREAYFLEFAKDLAAVAAMPLMTKGGIRRRAVGEQVLAGGVAMAGVALVKRRLRAVGAGQGAPRAYCPPFTRVADRWRTRRLVKRYRTWAGR